MKYMKKLKHVHKIDKNKDFPQELSNPVGEPLMYTKSKDAF